MVRTRPAKGVPAKGAPGGGCRQDPPAMPASPPGCGPALHACHEPGLTCRPGHGLRPARGAIAPLLMAALSRAADRLTAKGAGDLHA